MPGAGAEVNNSSPLNIRIKVNNANNIIYLSGEGFQTEIFMPTILEGRLGIINILPERRCKCISTSHIILRNSAQKRSTTTGQSAANLNQATLSSSPRFRTSTPDRQSNAADRSNFFENNVNRKLALANAHLSRLRQSQYLNISISRPAIAETRVSRDVSKKQQPTQSSLQQTTGIPDASNVAQPATPNNKRPKIQILSIQDLHTIPAGNERPQMDDIATEIGCELQQHTFVPASPELLRAASTISHNVSLAPSSPAPQNTSTLLGYISSIDYMETPPRKRRRTQEPCADDSNSSCITLLVESPEQAQWQNVRTPRRTYSRRQYSPNKSASTNSHSSSVHVSATQGLKAVGPIVPTKRPSKNKVILDQKILISPKSFEQQQSFDRFNVEQVQEQLRQEYWKCYFENKKVAAYDLFTMPTIKSQGFAPELIEMYKRRCLNKGSSTYPKYKKLAKVETHSTNTGRKKRTITKATEEDVVLEPDVQDSTVSQYTLISVADDQSAS